jgi:glycosyltransferase involved in cell wall biosynthesis
LALKETRRNPYKKTRSVTPKLWIDVEDLFEYARANPRPSGIQRLAFEIYRALQERPDAADFVRFVRHQPARNSFRVVPWQQIEALFAGLTEAKPEAPPAQPVAQPGRRFEEPRDTGPILPHPPARQFMRKLVHRLPPSLRAHVINVILTQMASLRAWGGLIDALARGVWLRVARLLGIRQRPVSAPAVMLAPPAGAPAATEAPAPAPPPPPPEETDETFADTAAPGDILVVLGSPWSHPDYASLVSAQRRRGLRFALLVYDLIPLRRPEWCDRGLVRLFRSWFDSVFPYCDHVFAISRATADDVEAYTRQRGIRLPGPVLPIPIGTSFGGASASAPPGRHRALPEGNYALIVSTIEARKNHILLFRVWRRMLEEMPRDQVPTLVFAGRVGWLVDDLMRQLANTDNLDGKLVIVRNPTDAELAQLYQGCLFTLFPSFFEGWGLPVTESLIFGKPCLTSNSTSLPEAGVGLTRSFDPDNLPEAYAAIRGVIEDPEDLAKWEARVRRDFTAIPWSATADALLAGLAHPAAAGADIDVEAVRSVATERREPAFVAIDPAAGGPLAVEQGLYPSYQTASPSPAKRWG